MNLSHIKTLSELRTAVERFDGCALKHTASQAVFSDGDAAAPLMVIGEAPGAEEDKSGKPFVGRSGQLLRKLLHEAGHSDAYITNMMFWRPPENRTPTKQELATTLPFVWRHIEIVKPQKILLVGNVPTQTLLGTKIGITKLHGTEQVIKINGHNYPAMPVYHPAYLLRNRSKIPEFSAALARLGSFL